MHICVDIVGLFKAHLVALLVTRIPARAAAVFIWFILINIVDHLFCHVVQTGRVFLEERENVESIAVPITQDAGAAVFNACPEWNP